MRRLSLQLVWFSATTAVVYLYYTYLHFQPARGALVIRAHGWIAFLMSALFVAPALFLGRLLLRVRYKMASAGRPSFLELAVTFLIALFTPVIVIGPPPVPYTPALWLYHAPVYPWELRPPPRYILFAAMLIILAFIVIRASVVAYESQLRRLGCVLAYLCMWYVGTVLFVGQYFI
jgi:hypothetical protein